MRLMTKFIDFSRNFIVRQVLSILLTISLGMTPFPFYHSCFEIDLEPVITKSVIVYLYLANCLNKLDLGWKISLIILMATIPFMSHREQ